MDYCNLALFSDLDGTLLDRNRQVSGRTGRLWRILLPAAASLGFPPDARR